jgi:hypothetical protein
LPDKADDALESARLAVRAAELAEGGEAWKKRLQGWARGFLANALLGSGKLRMAEAKIGEAWKLWQAGRNGDPDSHLPEWRLLDLEASLKRERGGWPRPWRCSGGHALPRRHRRQEGFW